MTVAFPAVPRPDATVLPTFSGAAPAVHTLPILSAGAVGAVAGRIDARMQSAGRVLAEVLGALDLMSGQLAAMCDAVAATDGVAALAELDRFAAALHALPARRGQRLALLVRAREIQTRLARSIVEIRQILQVLGIYGLNVTIAAASSDHSDDLIRSMSERLAEGDGHVTVFARRLDAVRRAVGSLMELDESLARECARVVPAVPDALHQAGVALGVHQRELTGVAQRMGQLVGAVRDRVAGALGALQIGDSTRQRLEHVAAGLHLLDRTIAELGPDDAAAADAAGRHLLGAQVRTAAAGLATGATELTAVFAALAPDAAALRRLREDSAAGASGQTLLRQLQASVSASEALTQRLRAIDGQTAGVSGLIGETVAALQASLADLGEIRSDVHHMAINIGLRYRGEDGVGAAARVVAGEINLYSRRLDEEAQRIAEAIAEMADLAAALDHSGLQDGGGDLGAVLTVIGRGTRAGETGAKAARHAVEAVLASLADARAMLAEQDRFAADLYQVAGPDRPPPPPPAAAGYASGFTAPLHALYTMAEERRLHSAIVDALAVDTGTVDPAAADDDLADFTLF